MSVEINIQYQGGLHCLATHGPSGTTLPTDAPVDSGGKGEAFSPTDLVATALGACVLTIMGAIASKNNMDLAGTHVKVVKEMTSSPLRRIGKVELVITFPKELRLSDADRSKFEKAVDSCPVKQSLHSDVKVDSRFVYGDA